MERMKETLGLSGEKDILLFVKNNNLHDTRDGLRGVLVLVNGRIGLVVKTVGSFILFQVLLPTREASSFRVIDLRLQHRRLGFYLQQVSGPRPGTLRASHRIRERETGYPYTKNTGHIFMNPDGPDFLVPAYKHEVPSNTWERFAQLGDNLCTKMYCEPDRNILRLRKSNTTNVIYVRDQALRKNMGDKANHFFVPCGVAHEERECPWTNKDGTRRR